MYTISWRPCILACLATTALLVTAPSVGAIQNGPIDTANHYSNVGAGVIVQPLVNRPPWDQIPVPWIGGSGVLIHPRVVLTAGHAVEEIEQAVAVGNSIDAVRISFAPNAYDSATWLNIDSFLKHPKYKSPNGAAEHIYDIGVLFLKEPVLHIAPAPLPEPFLLDSLRASGDIQAGANPTELTVVGYGLSDPNTFRADGLRRTGTLGFRSLRSTRLEVFGAQQGYSASMQGDSGGPIVWIDPDSNEPHYVATNTGWNKLETFSRIDLPDVLDFLYGAIELADDVPASAPALSGATVPEPSTLAAAACALAVAYSARRRSAQPNR